MNICYQLPDYVSNLPQYKKLKANIDTVIKKGHHGMPQTTIVPKKTARCIFVEKGIEY